MVDLDVIIEKQTKTTLRPPSKFNVILHNDDYTSMEFVILILMTIFHKSLDVANVLTLEIHNTGKGIAGTYTREIALQKRDETITLAVKNNFPLKCTVEEA